MCCFPRRYPASRCRKRGGGRRLVAGRIGEQPGIYKTDGSGAAVAVIYGAAAVAGLIFRKTAAIREKKRFRLASQEDCAAAAGGAVGEETAVGGSEGTGGQAGVQSNGPAGGRGLIILQQTALKMDFGGVCQGAVLKPHAAAAAGGVGGGCIFYQAAVLGGEGKNLRRKADKAFLLYRPYFP